MTRSIVCTGLHLYSKPLFCVVLFLTLNEVSYWLTFSLFLLIQWEMLQFKDQYLQLLSRLLIQIIVNCFPTRLPPNIQYFEQQPRKLFGIFEFLSAILKKYSRKPFFGDHGQLCLTALTRCNLWHWSWSEGQHSVWASLWWPGNVIAV